MADLRPFRGIRYGPTAGDPAALTAPPYDIIGPADHAALCARSPYNVVRLILGDRSAEAQAPPPDWHGAAAATLRAWRTENILRTDDTPAFYLYSQAFHYQDQPRRRKLLLAALRLEPYDAGKVLPHERTMPGPKADRLRLMQACHANLSPILAFFADPEGKINQRLDTFMGSDPSLAFSDEAGMTHELRCIFDPAAQAAVRDALAPLILYIADGHHRYETALAYQRLVRTSAPQDSDEQPCDYVLAACMSTADPGMVIGPTHRVIEWSGGPEAPELLTMAERWFDIQRLGPTTPHQDAMTAAEAITQASFVLYAGPSAGYALLTLRDHSIMADSPHPPASLQRSMPAPVLAQAIVATALADCEPRVTYTADGEEATRLVDEAPRRRVAGLLRPVRPTELMAVVHAGERMPPKSTYFWPKPLTGIVLRSLENL